MRLTRPACHRIVIDRRVLNEALMDASCCPLGAVCAGCGSTEHLRVVTSALSRPGGSEVACATLCHDRDGRSFLHLLTAEAFERAIEAQARHSQPDQRRGSGDNEGQAVAVAVETDAAFEHGRLRHRGAIAAGGCGAAG